MIFTRSPDNRVAVRLQNHRGEPPLGQIIRIVRKEPAIHVLRLRTGTVDFYPVLPAGVVILNSGIVVRHEFGNHQLGERRNIGVVAIGPTAAPKRIRQRSSICNSMIGCPGYLDNACVRRREIKRIFARADHIDICGRFAID